MIKAVIFDMEGTMVQTENLWAEVNKEFSQKYNFIFDTSMRVKLMGKNDYEAIQVIKDYYTLPQSIEELLQTRKEMIAEKLNRATVNAGLMELLHLLDTHAIKKAIATSASKKRTQKILESLLIQKPFDAIVTGDEISKSKPDPEIFLNAAERIHVEPKNCLVLEDAQNGVEAAKNANMKVIATPHEHSENHDFSKADLRVDSLVDITWDVISAL